jgi:putative polyketide hydroxylase
VKNRPQVVVIGAGPAGLIASLALARYAIGVLLVEKRERVSTLSRALVFSTRSMELLRTWGLEEAVREGAADVEPFGWVTRTLSAGEGTAFPLGYPNAKEAASVSPTRPAWAPQDHVEPLLLARLQASSTTEIRFLTELVALNQSDNCVRLRLRDRLSRATYDVETQYVIGADGAHSTLRSLLGIRMLGRDDLGEFQQVQFSAPLADLIAGTRYGINIVTHPESAGVLAPRGHNDRWLFAREWQPGQRRLSDMSHQALAQLVATAAGVDSVQPRIERVAAFSFAAQIADSYRHHRAFLVGDAAHRMTPRGGTGMNTAIQDGYDLGWKLAWVLRDWATPDLLDAYEAERRPVGLHNVARSADPNGARQEVEDALPWDLNGRLAHRWLQHLGKRVSTLDLLGDGLTLVASSHDGGRLHAADALSRAAPIVTRFVDAEIAADLGIPAGDTALFRPDGRALMRWSNAASLAMAAGSGVSSPANARSIGSPCGPKAGERGFEPLIGRSIV